YDGRELTGPVRAHASAAMRTRARSRCGSELGPVDLPVVGHALQRVGPAVGETDARAGDEVTDRARREDLARLGEGRDPRRDVDREAADLPVDHLALPGGAPAAHLDREVAARITDGQRALDPACRTVEGREEPVAGGVDLGATEAPELSS